MTLGLRLLLALLGLVTGPTTTAPPLSDPEVAAVARGIASAAGVAPSTRRTPVLVVPHHLVATDAIARAAATVRGQAVTRIVLVTPDHFDACPTTLCTSDEGVPTPAGVVGIDTAALAVLRASPLVTVQRQLFHREHGVRDVLPALHQALPGAVVVPIAVAQSRGWETEREALAALVASISDGATLLVASTDASHYLPLPQAEEADRRTLTALLAFDLDGVAQLRAPDETDCPACLWLAVRRARETRALLPTLLAHTNSAVLLGDPAEPETTSHLTLAFAVPDDPDPSDLAVAGDVTVARGAPAACLPPELAELWRSAALRAVNLEGPLQARCAAARNPYDFCNARTDFSRVAPLAELWSTVNNHALDRGADSQLVTGRTLGELGETPVSVVPVERGGYRLLAATTVSNPGTDGAGAAAASVEAALATLRADPHPELLTVVLLHAGVEFDPELPPADVELTHRLIDAGADAVLVSHAHVPGDVEFYGRGVVVRGLGNFVFDQFDRVATRTARVVRLRRGADGSVRVATAIAALQRGAADPRSWACSGS